jgi:hypothetical protein
MHPRIAIRCFRSRLVDRLRCGTLLGWLVSVRLSEGNCLPLETWKKTAVVYNSYTFVTREQKKKKRTRREKHRCEDLLSRHEYGTKGHRLENGFTFR